MYFKVSFPTKVLKQLPENVPPKNIFLLEFTIFFSILFEMPITPIGKPPLQFFQL